MTQAGNWTIPVLTGGVWSGGSGGGMMSSWIRALSHCLEAEHASSVNPPQGFSGAQSGETENGWETGHAVCIDVLLPWAISATRHCAIAYFRDCQFCESLLDKLRLARQSCLLHARFGGLLVPK